MFSVSRWAVIGVTVCGAIAAGGCGNDPGSDSGSDSRLVSVAAVYGEPKSMTLEISTNSCNQDPTASVTETPTSVEIEVTAADSGSAGDDCLDHVMVTLKTKLGSRTVMDASTNEQVKVLPPD
jgi:hypothetical protein